MRAEQEQLERVERLAKNTKNEEQMEEIRRRGQYNLWMKHVYYYPAESFQITAEQFKSGPFKGPWASQWYKEEVRQFIASQQTPIYLRTLIEIEKEKASYTPEAMAEGQAAIDRFLSRRVR